MKMKNYKILACVLSLGLIMTPNAALAAGVEAEPDDIVLEEEMVFDELEAEEEDWEEDEEIEDDEEWEEDEEWEDDEDWYVEDASWDDEDDVLPVMYTCDANPCDAGTECMPKSNAADDSEAEESPESAAAAESQAGTAPSAVKVKTSFARRPQSKVSYKAGYAASKDSAIAGTYTTVKKTRLQASAGAVKTAFLKIDKNTKIHCYGYYTEVNGLKWYYVQYFQNGRSVIGFCSSEDLK